MNQDCEAGLRLRKRFEDDLREWGRFDACQKAIEIMPVGLPKIREFQIEVKNAESALFKSRYAYADHMATCVICSRRLVEHDAIAHIRATLKDASEVAN